MTAGANLFLQLLGEAGVKSAPAKTIRAVGIDLGTTNSTISEVVWNAEAGAPEAVRTLDVDQKTPMGLYTHVLVPDQVAPGYIRGAYVANAAALAAFQALNAALPVTINHVMFF